MTRHEHALELLDRCLSYTRGRLAEVRDDDLARPTPCAEWDLGELLAHLDDALGAFAEGAVGHVGLDPRTPVTVRVAHLQAKAGALLGAWTVAGPRLLHVGDLLVDSAVLVETAALEVVVHGWDVGQASGHGRPVPADLARRLLPLAHDLVADDDRGVRFAAPCRVGDGPHDSRDPGAELLAFLGRAPART